MFFSLTSLCLCITWLTPLHTGIFTLEKINTLDDYILDSGFLWDYSRTLTTT